MDIISVSFGFYSEHPDVTAAINNALEHRKISDCRQAAFMPATVRETREV